MGGWVVAAAEAAARWAAWHEQDEMHRFLCLMTMTTYFPKRFFPHVDFNHFWKSPSKFSHLFLTKTLNFVHFGDFSSQINFPHSNLDFSPGSFTTITTLFWDVRISVSVSLKILGLFPLGNYGPKGQNLSRDFIQ